MAEKKKRRLWWIWLIAAAVLGLGYWFYTGINGSLIARTVTTIKVNSYVKANYNAEDYDVCFAEYDFKLGSYFCTVQSKTSEDAHFQVTAYPEGFYDDYAWCVDGMENTRFRLDRALDDYVVQYFEENYDRRTALLYSDSGSVVLEELKDKLTLDMPFDIDTYPLPATLVVWVETANDEPTWGEMAERLRELEAFVREDIPCIKYFSVSVESKYVQNANDGGYDRTYDGKSISVFDVPREVITGDGLEAYLDAVREEQEAEEAAIAAREEAEGEATAEEEPAESND